MSDEDDKPKLLHMVEHLEQREQYVIRTVVLSRRMLELVEEYENEVHEMLESPVFLSKTGFVVDKLDHEMASEACQLVFMVALSAAVRLIRNSAIDTAGSGSGVCGAASVEDVTAAFNRLEKLGNKHADIMRDKDALQTVLDRFFGELDDKTKTTEGSHEDDE